MQDDFFTSTPQLVSDIVGCIMATQTNDKAPVLKQTTRCSQYIFAVENDSSAESALSGIAARI
jgi:hypothetical protein